MRARQKANSVQLEMFMESKPKLYAIQIKNIPGGQAAADGCPDGMYWGDGKGDYTTSSLDEANAKCRELNQTYGSEGVKYIIVPAP